MARVSYAALFQAPVPKVYAQPIFSMFQDSKREMAVEGISVIKFRELALEKFSNWIHSKTWFLGFSALRSPLSALPLPYITSGGASFFFHSDRENWLPVMSITAKIYPRLAYTHLVDG